MKPQQGFKPFVRTLGDGPRPVLALHCTMAHSGAWAVLRAAMGDGLRFVAPDMPSHGGSPDWDEVSGFAETVYAASEGVADGPMDVIGHSFGGAVALALALSRPDLVRSVALFEPVFFGIAQRDAPEAFAAHEAQASEFYTALENGDRETGARAFNRMWTGGTPRWADIPQKIRDAMQRAVHVVPGTQSMLIDDSWGLFDRLRDVKPPVLLMRGAQSISVIPATHAGLAARLPGAQSAVLDGVGHMGPITHPGAVARVWQPFLNEMSPL